MNKSMQGQRAHAVAQAVDAFPRLPRRQVLLTLGGVMLAIFLASLDQTIVGTAMPRIIADLGGFDRYTWVTTSYLVASTAIVPISGRLSDIYGRKWFYIGGITIFLIGSVLSGLSSTIGQLIAYRAIQGVGAGVMMAIAFVSVGDLFPPAERGKYQGVIAAVFGLSSVIGPTLGGFITDTLSWHWVFFVNVPVGVVVIALFVRFFPAFRPAGVAHSVDYLGVVLLLLSVVPLLMALSWGGVQYEWASPQTIGMLAFAAAMTALFLLQESRATEPILPLSIFSNRVVSVSLAAVFLTGFAMFGGIIFIPLFFQGVLGSSATSSGSFLTPMMLGTVFGAAISGQLLSRLGGRYRIQGLAGVGLMAVGTFLVSRMDVQTSYVQAVANIVLLGFGLGITFPVFTIAVQNAVPYTLMGVATSSTQFFRSIGGTLGLAILGSFMVGRFKDDLAAEIPETARQALPPGMLDQMASNPQALVSPQAMDGMQQTFAQMGPQGAELARQVVLGLREALAFAISNVFVVSLVVLALAFVVTLLLKEIPLQRRRHGAVAPAEPTAAD